MCFFIAVTLDSCVGTFDLYATVNVRLLQIARKKAPFIKHEQHMNNSGRELRICWSTLYTRTKECYDYYSTSTSTSTGMRMGMGLGYGYGYRYSIHCSFALSKRTHVDTISEFVRDGMLSYLPTTDYRLPTTVYRLLLTGCRLPGTVYRLRTTQIYTTSCFRILSALNFFWRIVKPFTFSYKVLFLVLFQFRLDKVIQR